MLTITPTGKTLGANVTGIDLSTPLSTADFAQTIKALGQHGVLRFSGQRLTAAQIRDFSLRFGPIQVGVSEGFRHPQAREVGILSNVVENGKPIGVADAGQDWHTDMSYRDTIGFVNVLYAVKVPVRNGLVLGDTLFANMHAAYEGLASEWKSRLAGMTATHDFNKFWENMRQNHASTRPPLSPEQRAKRPPVVHPIFMTHPITGRTVLYCNPGYATRINEMSEAESDKVLDMLFTHQLQDKYLYRHSWQVNDLLIWEHIGTLHNALPDYGPDEHRLMLRCQVMSTPQMFEPGFLSRALEEGSAVH
ncbi:MAG: TauD/TfdA family dioxygenase [Betaproteobacteria bacterium]|nr:TauD/TfdA family dioxygenase [Betaproteobacteria bacterium]